MSVVITILFLCVPFIAIPLLIIGIILDKKHNVIYGILLALLLAIIAYNFNPNEMQDLYRYYYEMDVFYSNIDFDRYMEDAFDNTKIVFKALQFLFSQIGNFRLLPFFITFIGYSITFYIILDYSKIKKINPYITLFTIMIFMCTFYHINFMSGLAQYLAMTIAFLGFYLEFVKKKKKIIYKLLYVIPIFIHISMIIVLAFRILMIFDFKKTKKYFLIFLIIYAILPSILYNILNLIPRMEIIATKINSYMVQGNRNLSRII